MRHLVGGLLIVSLVCAVASPVTASARSGRVPAVECLRWDTFGRCEKTVPVPVATPVASPGQADDDSAPSTVPPPPNCRWRSMPNGADFEWVIGPPDPGLANPVMQFYGCDEPELPDGFLGVPIGFRWVDAGEPVEAGPPPPEVLAAVLYARVQASMVAPTVATDPPQTSPAVVRLPVFVEVTNWQGELADQECVAGLCVTMTATPRLTFDPGEPGARPMVCNPPGNRFDPAGPAATAQAAAPGACAWAYQSRSGTTGRPAAWPGEVTIDWTVSWSASDGTDGTFPGLSFGATVPRVVDEVQTVVTDDE